MKIIYSAKNSPALFVAAHYHMNLLRKDDLYNKDYILNLFTYDMEKGRLIYMGLDKHMNEIYILNHGGVIKVLKNAIKGFSEIYNLNYEDIIFIQLDKFCFGLNLIKFFLTRNTLRNTRPDFFCCNLIFKRFLKICQFVDKHILRMS